MNDARSHYQRLIKAVEDMPALATAVIHPCDEVSLAGALQAAERNPGYVPVGFAHGFVTLLPYSEIIYKCSNYYAPETEGAVRWDDPAIGIDWPLEGDAILSGKDAAAPLLSDLNSPFTWEGRV